ncbi:13897_t:CDS:2, partial [Dentiscutata heterogama]
MATSTSQTLPGGFGGFGLDSFPISQERLSLLNRFKSERLGNIRPMGEFFDRGRISKPKGMGGLVLHDRTITQKQLYMGLFGISVPLLWISSAGSTIFWII